MFEMMAHVMQPILGRPFTELDLSLDSCPIKIRVHDPEGSWCQDTRSLKGVCDLMTWLAFENCWYLWREAIFRIEIRKSMSLQIVSQINEFNKCGMELPLFLAETMQEIYWCNREWPCHLDSDGSLSGRFSNDTSCRLWHYGSVVLTWMLQHCIYHSIY